jgi:murein DD-endopeptidase MepM/ murein hydrolase activator NlpD
VKGLRKRIALFFENLRRKMRIVGMDPVSYEEHWQFTGTPINFIYMIIGALLLTSFVTYLLIAHTFLREYIIGETGEEQLQRALEAEERALAAEEKLDKEIAYWQNYRDRIEDEFAPVAAADSIANRSFNPDTIRFERSAADSALREKIESQGAGTPGKAVTLHSAWLFYAPALGEVVQHQDLNANRFGTTVKVDKNAIIHAALDGTVVFCGWTGSGGLEIHIQHTDGLMTMYRNNATALVSTGSRVRTGAPLATVSDDGTGSARIAFELWQHGRPLDPEKYIIFAPYGD